MAARLISHGFQMHDVLGLDLASFEAAYKVVERERRMDRAIGLRMASLAAHGGDREQIEQFIGKDESEPQVIRRLPGVPIRRR